LDAETRGLIEKGIDTMLQEASQEDGLKQEVKWVEDEILIKSPRDLMIGWLLGWMQAFSQSICLLAKRRFTEKQEEEDNQEILTILRQKLSEVERTVTIELNR
jgi:hypothetical protein